MFPCTPTGVLGNIYKINYHEGNICNLSNLVNINYTETIIVDLVSSSKMTRRFQKHLTRVQINVII